MIKENSDLYVKNILEKISEYNNQDEISLRNDFPWYYPEPTSTTHLWEGFDLFNSNENCIDVSYFELDQNDLDEDADERDKLQDLQSNNESWAIAKDKCKDKLWEKQTVEFWGWTRHQAILTNGNITCFQTK